MKRLFLLLTLIPFCVTAAPDVEIARYLRERMLDWAIRHYENETRMRAAAAPDVETAHDLEAKMFVEIARFYAKKYKCCSSTNTTRDEKELSKAHAQRFSEELEAAYIKQQEQAKPQAKL